MDKLTPKQKLFCEYYIINWNATDAYQKAYPNIKKEATAAAAASRLLRNVNIEQYIKEIQEDIAKQLGISRISVAIDYLEIKTNAEKDSDKIKALDSIRKMLGFDEPEKSERKTDVTINDYNKIDFFDTDT